MKTSMAKKKKITSVHVVIVGDKKVGKYSLREQFVKGWIAPKDFDAPPGPTTKTTTINGVKVEIAVSCCADIKNPDPSISTCDGVVIAYNISNKSSLDFIKTEANEFLQGKFPTEKTDPANGEENKQETSIFAVPIVLAGNKADEAKLSRNVTTEEGENLSKELNCVGFFETSATCNENVPKLFECLVQRILDSKKNLPSEKGKRKSSKSKCTIL